MASSAYERRGFMLENSIQLRYVLYNPRENDKEDR
jgi:hypothetical protein